MKMASLLLTVSFLSATLSSYFVAANHSNNGYTMPQLSLNPIDSCWRGNPNWASSRHALANCAVGFGKTAIGGKHGPIYVVKNPSDDPRHPKPGTLRYGAIQSKPLWITFARDMVIALKYELLVSSYKTIDGRGAKVEITNGPCITMKRVSHVIIHGISFHGCKTGLVRRGSWDGDAIRVFQSTHVWIDHCSFARCQDGLVDVIHSSTAVTISNNYFTHHEKTMLLGHDDRYVDDKKMRVTIAFNRFGPGLTSRMPRVRRGYAHVANNMYEKWLMYAIGGSADPIIFSEGNYFVAPNDHTKKQVTKKMTLGRWKISTSSKDVFKNGAYFGPSGGAVQPFYKGGESFLVAHGSLVPSLTSSAGVLSCYVGRVC